MLIIMTAGIITIYSASYVYAFRTNGSGSTDSFIDNHLLFIVIGIVTMLILELINYKSYRKIIWIIYTVLAGLLIVTKIYGIINGYPAARWIKVGGMSIQITEFVKIFIVYFVADYIASNRLYIYKANQGIIRPFFYILPILILTFIEPDLGTTIILVLISMTMLFIAGAKMRHIIVFSLLILLIVVFVSINFFPYQWDRLLHSSVNAQVLNGERGIGSGGLIGKGIGHSTEKYSMTQSFTDFIFVTFGEEFGMIGMILLLLSYWMLFYYILINARFVKDEFGRFYLVGFALYLFLQVLINISGVLAITPVKGLTVPLLSYGGSSTIATLIGFGIVLNIIKTAPKLGEKNEDNRNKINNRTNIQK
jgi:cell division protein FtsW